MLNTGCFHWLHLHSLYKINSVNEYQLICKYWHINNPEPLRRFLRLNIIFLNKKNYDYYWYKKNKIKL